MKKMMMPLAAGILLLACSVQKQTKVKQTTNANDERVKADTSKKGPKPYRELVTSAAVTRKGLCTVHKIGERYYFEIAGTLMGRDLLIVNRIAKAAADNRPLNAFAGYGGDHIGENVVQFTKGPNQKIFIRRISYREVSRDSSENGMYRSVLNSGLQPIVASFDIKAFTPDSSGVVIDLTDYINGDNDVLFFAALVKKDYGLGALQPDKSYIVGVTSFPLNTEIKTIKTYAYKDQLLTYELNSSLVLLPAEPMRPRYRDERVGYFATGYLDFDVPQQVKPEFMITRWRMEPRAEDREKYQRGELVEPQKPVIFYIDPATPQKWIPYIIKGVNAWQQSFEKAGFKNAIYALPAPLHDSTWSLEDARHNVIVYKASPVRNASGPQVSDPRSGEILESHINWYHNIQQLLHDWYFVQASPSDVNARKIVFDDSLMGKLITYVCAHEVGHTLGLQHNFMASAAIPVDSLRSRHYIAANGHTPSIMDYARFNYVAQPEDSIAANDLIPRIGIYDDWAINWGYRWLPAFTSKEEEKIYLGKWIVTSTQEDKRRLFNANPVDGRVQWEDLGDDAVKAGRYGIKNLKFVTAHLKEWTATPNNLYTNLSAMYKQVIAQYTHYLDHVLNRLMGAYWIKKSVEQGGTPIGFPGRKELRAAIRFFNDELFETPYWLDDKAIFLLAGGGRVIEELHAWYVHHLVSPETYNVLHMSEHYMPATEHYSFDELLTDLETGIFTELNNKAAISFNRRYLQKTYITRLIGNIRLQKVGFLGRTDFTTLSEYHIKALHLKINKVLSNYPDKESRLHLADIATRLQVALDYQKKNYPEPSVRIPIPLPTGIDAGEFKEAAVEQWPAFRKKMNSNCWENELHNH